MAPTTQLSAGAPASFFTRLMDRLRRFGERRALQKMLALRSDRLLADIGYDRTDLAGGIDIAVASLQQRRDTERRIQHELAGHSDAELQAMGITRLDIRRVARERAQQAVPVSRPLTAQSA